MQSSFAPPRSGNSGPLAGVRVIDLTSVLMGPLASQYLGDLGANVIKVEPPGGEQGRKVGPGGEEAMGALFLQTNRNKRSIALDLRNPAGRDALLRLVETADVVTCNLRPQSMARLRLAYEDLAAVNPRIIYVSMFGFSQRGRYASAPAFDDVIQAATGVPWALAAALEGEPRYLPINAMDRSVGLYAFGIIASALYACEKTGIGQRVDVPMFETMPSSEPTYRNLVLNQRIEMMAPFISRGVWVLTVPDGDADTEVALESIITANPPTAVSDAQLAVLQAQALVDQATTQARAAALSAAQAGGIGGYVVTTWT